MKNIIGLLLILIAACIVKCSCFVPSRLPLPVTIQSERQHELRASKNRRKKSEDDTNINNTTGGEQDVVAADQMSSAGNLDQDSSGVPKQTTLSGGTSLIFDMARRMLVWDDELYQGLNDASPSSDIYSPKVSTTTKAAAANAAAVAALPRWRPKSITQQSISNANPSFRTSSPIMTNAGYASILKRNSRKKNKPSMWRHCLRVYDKMGELENAQIRSKPVEVKNSNGNTPVEKMPRGVGSNLSPSASNTAQKSTVQKGKKIKIKRSTAHHEAALVAASKLGLWEEALCIFQGVEKASTALNNITAASNASEENKMYMKRKQSRITDNMVLSVIKACVRGSRAKQTTSVYFDSGGNEANMLSDNATEANTIKYDGENEHGTPTRTSSSTTPPSLRLLTIEERRKPLDLARDIILNMEEQHDIPLVSRHVNPLASAYLDLGLRSEAVHLINNLNDRNPPSPVTQPKKSKTDKSELTSDNPRFSEGVQLVSWRDDDLDDIDTEDEENEINNGYASPQLNVFEVQSKDRGSYSLLVKGAVMDEDWAGAVAELQRMNDAGLHPNASNLNSWSEVMERGCRPAGKREAMDDNYYNARQRRRSWRKRRDGIWLGNLH